MEYEELSLAQVREMIRGNVEQAERQHYQLVINKIANVGNKNADQRRQIDEPIATAEAAVKQLRDELHRVDELIAREAAATPPEPVIPADPGTPHVVSAVDGDVSQPGNDAPAP